MISLFISEHMIIVGTSSSGGSIENIFYSNNNKGRGRSRGGRTLLRGRHGSLHGRHHQHEGQLHGGGHWNFKRRGSCGGYGENHWNEQIKQKFKLLLLWETWAHGGELL